MKLIQDLLHRLRFNWLWVAAQFIAPALFISLGLAWTRLPEKHLWQVALTLLLPLLLLAAILGLHAAAARSFMGDPQRIKLAWGATTLILWYALFSLAWWLLGLADDKIDLWAGYLNSKADAHARAKFFTYQHLTHWLTVIEWIIRWIIVPGALLPAAAASAQWGLRGSLAKAGRVILNWRWWPAVIVAALLAVELPSRFFTILPKGTVTAQVWHVSLKLIATYLLAACSWVLLLGWVAVLYGRAKPPAKEDEELVPIPTLVGPPDEPRCASVTLPLPEIE